MSQAEFHQSSGSVSVDQLVALNDEMAALVRAGVPLERGLVEAGRDLRGRLGSIVGGLGERLGRGERLSDVLGESGRGLPVVFAAVAEAGLRSGRLAQALEGLATLARGYGEARRSVGIALLYPLIVVMLAWGLFVGFVVEVAPRFAVAFEALGLPLPRLVEGFAQMGDSAIYWGPSVPAVLLILAVRWLGSGRSTSLDGGLAGSLAGRLPGVGRMVADFRSANFAELLALLIEHQVPMAGAIQLAADASGDRAFRARAVALADRVRSGEVGPARSEVKSARSFPPMLAWIVTDGARQGSLGPALGQAAMLYRRRAEDRARTLRTMLPSLLLVVIGASTVLMYGLVLFLPLTSMWDGLATPINR